MGPGVVWREVEELVSGASRGGAALVVRGERGCGKTALLRRASALAAERGLTVLEARGHGPDGEALGVLKDLLRPVLRAPAGAAGVLDGAVAAALADAIAPSYGVISAAAVRSATCDALTALGGGGGLLVVLDDWGAVDEASQAVLAPCLSRLAGAHAAVLVAVADPSPCGGPAGAALTAWPTVALGGLDPGEAGAVVSRIAGGPAAPDVVAALLRLTGGNPAVLEELARSLTREQLTGAATLPRVPVGGPAAGRVFQARLDVLSDGARDALLTVVLGEEDEPAAVEGALVALGVPVDAREELEAAGLVELGAGSTRLRHPLLALAATGAASAVRRRAVHRALADASRSPRSMELRVAHLEAAAMGSSEEIAQAMEAVARESAQLGGFTSAGAVLVRAATLGDGGLVRAERLLLAGECLAWAGDSEGARKLLEEATRHDDSAAVRVRADHGLGRIDVVAGRPGQAARVLQAGATRVASEEPVAAARMLAHAALAELLSGRGRAAAELAERAIGLGGAGAGGTAVAAEMILGLTGLGRGDVHGALSRLSAVPDPSELPEVDDAVLAGILLVWTGRPARAAEWLAGVEHELRRTGALGPLPLVLYAGSSAALALGRVREADAQMREALEVARTSQDGFWRFLALGGIARVEALAGDADAARAAADEAEVLMDETDFSHPRDAQVARGLLALAAGDGAAALTHLHPAGFSGAPPDARLLDWAIGPDLAEAYARQRVAIPAQLVAQLEALAGEDRHPAYAAAACRSLALLEEGGQADARFERAQRLYGEAGLSLDRARTQLLHGAHLRRRGRRTEARVRLLAAEADLARLGAHLWSRRAAAELGRAEAAPETSAFDTLTPHERQVAEVVAGGATNREAAATLYLSTKTVEMHLSRVYRKLGLRSRAELVRAYPGS